MKIYPTQQKNKKAEGELTQLSTTEKVTKVIALIAAFGTVYFFFIKILFL